MFAECIRVECSPGTEPRQQTKEGGQGGGAGE